VCPFCDIAAGSAEAEIVFNDDVSIGFLDVRPVFAGHTLLIPREHHETLADLPDELIDPLFRRARLLSRVVPEAVGAKGSFVAMNNVVSQSVPHLHIHIVPRSPKDGLRGFFWPRRRYGAGEMESVGAAIRARLAEEPST
jgi:histidine triad (HIT) family protein